MRGCERPERSEEGKERVGGGTECRKTDTGLGKVGVPRGLRAPHRSRVNGNVLLRAGARLSVFALGAHGTKQVVRGVVGPCVGNDSCQDSAVLERERVGVRAARRRESLFSLRPARSRPLWKSFLSLCARLSAFTPLPSEAPSRRDIRPFLPSPRITGLAGC